jgi:molecular chaperone DnaJ
MVRCNIRTLRFMHVEDPYHDLGLRPDSTDEEVKAAWRRLSAQWHPDRNKSPHALRNIQRINRALEEIRRARKNPDAGADETSTPAAPEAQHVVHLTLEEVVTGCTKEVRGELVEDCGDCAGSGLQPHARQCMECDGSGLIRQGLWFGWVSQTVECGSCQGHGTTRQACAACGARGKAPPIKYSCRVKVAPGARAGDLLDVSARIQGRKRTLALRLRIELHPHDLFTADADGTLNCEMPVDGFAWMANRWIEVPTPRGLQQMKLRRDALGYRIKGAGLPWGSQARTGDCIVTVVPLFPEALNPEQEAAIDRLVKSNSGAAGTVAGDRTAEWRRLLEKWQSAL